MGDPSPIHWVSPSAVARLQACGLAESRRRGHPHGVQPSSPGARLGTATHRVLEWIARSAPELASRDDAEDVIATRWTQEIARERTESESNALERSYGPPERWPAYGRIAAGVKVDGVALANELAQVPSDRRLVEVELASSDERLRGTADLIVVGDDGGALIVDHKTGDARDEDVSQGGQYEQQVLL